MNQLTNEELTNILALINRSQIQGQEAIVVAVLQQKIQNLLKEENGKQTPTDMGSDK